MTQQIHFTDKFIAVDTETTGLSVHTGCRPFVVSACDYTGETFYWQWPVGIEDRVVHPVHEQVQEIKRLIERYDYVVFHNAKFDMRMLNSIGLFHSWDKVHDTLIASHVMNSAEPHGLKYLGAKYAKIPVEDEEDLKALVREARRIVRKDGVETPGSVAADYWLPTACGLGSEHVQRYAVQDAIRTALLWKLYVQALSSDQARLDCYNRERDLLAAVYDIESAGLNVLYTPLLEQIKLCTRKCELLKRKINQFAFSQGMPPEFNIRSARHVQTLFYGILKLPIVYFTKGGQGSTSAEAIEVAFAQQKEGTRIHQFLQQVLEFRSTETSLKYLLSYQEQLIHAKTRGGINRWYDKYTLYPSFNTTGTRTTRFSSHNPNAQNIGKRSDNPLRKVFGPPPTHNWYAMDYDQIELRVFAKASKEPRLIDCFEKEEDVHQMTADAFGVNRPMGKAINFAILYGAGAKKINRMTGIEEVSAYAQYKKAYPRASEFMREVEKEATNNGCIHTLYGYPLQVQEDRAYAALNYMIQGTAGDMLKNAVIAIHNYIREHKIEHRIRIVMLIHDEIIFETHRRFAQYHLRAIYHIMRLAGAPIDVYCPVSVSRITTSWDMKEEIQC